MKVFLTIVLVLIASICWGMDALETTLDTPITTTTIKIYKVTLVPETGQFDAEYRMTDSQGIEISKNCSFEDSNMMESVIQAGRVGDMYVDVIREAVDTKCKTINPEWAGS
jgi:hypothetical protein